MNNIIDSNAKEICYLLGGIIIAMLFERIIKCCFDGSPRAKIIDADSMTLLKGLNERLMQQDDRTPVPTRTSEQINLNTRPSNNSSTTTTTTTVPTKPSQQINLGTHSSSNYSITTSTTTTPTTTVSTTTVPTKSQQMNLGTRSSSNYSITTSTTTTPTITVSTTTVPTRTSQSTNNPASNATSNNSSQSTNLTVRSITTTTSTNTNQPTNHPVSAPIISPISSDELIRSLDDIIVTNENVTKNNEQAFIKRCNELSNRIKITKENYNDNINIKLELEQTIELILNKKTKQKYRDYSSISHIIRFRTDLLQSLEQKMLKKISSTELIASLNKIKETEITRDNESLIKDQCDVLAERLKITKKIYTNGAKQQLKSIIKLIYADHQHKYTSIGYIMETSTDLLEILQQKTALTIPFSDLMQQLTDLSKKKVPSNRYGTDWESAEFIIIQQECNALITRLEITKESYDDGQRQELKKIMDEINQNNYNVYSIMQTFSKIDLWNLLQTKAQNG